VTQQLTLSSEQVLHEVVTAFIGVARGAGGNVLKPSR
jgi:hypothetical protein